MNREEKELLRKAVDSPCGSLTPSIFINSMAGKNTKAVTGLITSGFIEEFSEDHMGRTIKCYRVTKAGRRVLSPLPLRVFWWFSADLKTVFISLITTVITTAVIKILGL